MLDDREIARFEHEGWVGPFDLLSEEQCADLGPELERCFAQTRGYFYPDRIEPGRSYYDKTPWFQSLHALSPMISSIGQRREIVDRVTQLLGEDVLLWGGIRFGQGPGESLHWHTDTEFDHVEGVSIWLGAQNVTPDNALKIIPGSETLQPDPERLQSDGELTMEDLVSDDLALSLARKRLPDARIVRPAVRDGQFFIFKGKLWHASDNPAGDYRIAMGLRYSPASCAVRTPLTYLHPIQWDPTPPPCILVNGENRYDHNRIIEPPGA